MHPWRSAARRPRLAVTLVAVGVLALGLAGCSAPQSIEWRLRFSDVALESRASVIEVTLGSGECSDPSVLYRAKFSFSDGAAASRPPRLGPGRYHVSARASDGMCTFFAEGCVTVDLPASSDAPVEVVLEPNVEERECPAGECAAGVCAAGFDAGVDGGMQSSDGAIADAKQDSATCNPAACPGRRCTGGVCDHYATCKAMKSAFPTLPSGVYEIDPDEGGPLTAFSAYCEMAEDGGGWTLVMKIDGAETTFTYDASLWTTTSVYRADRPAFDENEAKLASYSTVPFTEVRLGMAVNNVRHWFVGSLAGSSLYALVSPGTQIDTTFGRNAWRSLVDVPVLQDNCNREGVNASTRTIRLRLGIIGNGENDCNTPDSWLGFGAKNTGGCNSNPISAATVGNANTCSNVAIEAFGYIMVR